MNFRPTLVIIDTHMSVSILLVATDRNPTLISLNISYKGKNNKQKKENIMMYFLKLINLFIYGCVGSSFLSEGFL